MNSNTTKPYWRAYLDRIEAKAPFDTRGYFSTITEPSKLNQFDLYKAIKPSLQQRPALDRWWGDVHNGMQTNRDATIKRLGVTLRQQQEEARTTKADEKFWKEVEVRQAIEEDQLINLRMTTDAKKDALLLKYHYTEAVVPSPTTPSGVTYPAEVHTNPPIASSSSRSGLLATGNKSNTGSQSSPVRDQVELRCNARATENPFLVGPLESLLQCVFDHYSNRVYRLPVGPKEFPSKNIEMLFQASRSLLQENIEDKLALVFISKIVPLKFLDNEIFPTSLCKAIEQKTAGKIEMHELNSSLKNVLSRLYTNTYSAKEIMDEITLIKYEAIERSKDGCTRRSMDDTVNSEVAVALEIIHYFALMISHKKIRRGLSETAYVAHWNFVWNMLFGPSLQYDIGELCSKATKEDMLFNEKAYDGVTSSQTGGRKIDVFVRVYDEAMEEMVELGVNEHKPASANEKILDLQLKKLMRINRSILARIPVTLPQLFFDVHGMTARLYAMTPVEDIYGCSRSLARVVLPCTEADMRHFLQGDVFKVLFMYKV
ncbi:hypothetical protein EC968_000786 [Mortierella alpina]|nr:hypothetical protein EC968_000786 [Mortierella alpina]